MEDDDPWDWSIDRVVQEFCTDKRSWELRAASNRLPNPAILEKAFRDNEIQGDVLLFDLDDKSLRDDLQISKLGWRSFIRYGIDQLRQRSPKYKDWLIKERSLALPTPAIDRYSNQSPSVSSRGDINFTINSTIPIQMPSGVPGIQNSPVPALSPLRLLTEKEVELPISNLQEATKDVSSISGDNKRQRLDSQSLAENPDLSLGKHPLEPLSELSISLGNKLVQREDFQSEQFPSNESNHISSAAQPTRKRKRVAPILVTTAIDKTRDRTIPTEADTVRIYLHSQLDHGYLGNTKMSVNDVFYGSVAEGEQIPAGQLVVDFYQRSAISSGRRLYIHSLMKHFLCANPVHLERNEQTLMAIKPYHLHLDRKASFTLYRPGPSDTIEVTRQALLQWPELNPDTAVNNSSKTGKSTFDFDMNVEGDLLANAYEDPGALNKYNMLRDDDEVLPLYGDSGSEDSYDTETWEAMKQEAKERAAYMEKEKQKYRFLTPQQVEKAVDASIADLVSQWQERKLPKRRQKAYRFWTKSRRTGSKYADILKAQQGLKHLVDNRIPKLKENIILGQWSNELQVRNQTRIMEATIFDREDLVYTIALLQNKSPPPKFATVTPVKTKKTIVSGNDSDSGESIHSESSEVQSADDIGDFVVEELNLADDEDDTTMSDDSLPAAQGISSQKITFKGSPSQNATRALTQPGPSVRQGHSSQGDGNMASFSDDQELGSPEPIEHSPFKPKHEPSAAPFPISTPTKTATFIDLITPESNRVSKLKLRFKSSSPSNPIVLSSESDRDQQIRRPALDRNHLPSLTTPASVSRFDYKTWEDLNDRNRLIISAVDKLPNYLQTSLFELIAIINDEVELRDRISESIDLGNEAKGLDEQLSRALLTLVRLLWIFIDCKFHLADDGWMRIATGVIRNDGFNSLSHFYELCKSLRSYFNPKIRFNFRKAEFSSESTLAPEMEEDDEPQGLVKRKRKSVSPSDSEESFDEEQESPNKKQKQFFEDADARDLREQDRARVAAQEERKKQLRARLRESDNIGDVRLDRHIINEGKYDDQGYIYVDEEIGKRIKSHQLGGVRFIWNQITADGKATQGCLLAHTMGLGKTMQTITILVALAQAASSTDESILSQIPKSLRVSRTIILCPPGLIANWMDELLTWSPDDILGDLRPIESASTPASRLRTINEWFREGGILLMGYEMFRRFIAEPKPKPGQLITPLNKKAELARTQLLEGPNVVVADEAHRMKNSKSALTIAASQFRTKTRIALTGSPLANNVEEYHTMVEWVAPNYLGPIAEFRMKYKDPIEQGMYLDSTKYEKRKSLKMLHVLKEDLFLKVHRADTSVLRDDLPPKKEFIITVSLTELQKQAYITYVRSTSLQTMARTKAGEHKQTSVWAYINILTLLCNHPSCFKAKLDERRNEVQKSSQQGLKAAKKSKPIESRDVTDDDLEDDPEAWKVDVSEDLISAEAKVFQSVEGTITSPELSNKVRILCQILDASRIVGDKVLVFSQTLATIDFLEAMCKEQGRRYARLDGKTPMNKRQTLVKDFNLNHLELCLISTNAGGLGLNLYGANRVVIFDFRYNPINEEQAIGRVYRIGQKKKVFVYRLMSAGTFEGNIQNKAVFKTQLASRVVDKKNPVAWAQKGLGEILFEPKEVQQEDLSAFEGMDAVLDNILSIENNKGTILKIIQSDDFEKDDNDRLTAVEKEEAQVMLQDEKLKRSDPAAFRLLMDKRDKDAAKLAAIQQAQLIQQRHQQAQLLQQRYQQSQVSSSMVKKEMPSIQKPGKNSDNQNDDSDVQIVTISEGQNSKMIFVKQLRKIAKATGQLLNEDGSMNQEAYRKRTELIDQNFRSHFHSIGRPWNDDRERMVYQRSRLFIMDKGHIPAQRLLSLDLDAEQFINQVNSFWAERSQANNQQSQNSGQQPQNLVPMVNGQALPPAVPLVKNNDHQATDKDAGVSSMVPSQPHPLGLESKKLVKSPNIMAPKTREHMNNNDIPYHQSGQAVQPGGENVPLQAPTDNLPKHEPTSSLSEVKEHPVSSTISIEKQDQNGCAHITGIQPLGEDGLNDLIDDAPTNSNGKGVKSGSSLPTMLSSSGELKKLDSPQVTTISSSDNVAPIPSKFHSKMYHAISRQPQALNSPVRSPSKKTKGLMHAEDLEVLRQVKQKRLDKQKQLARQQGLHSSNSPQAMQSVDRSSQGPSAGPKSFPRPQK